MTLHRADGLLDLEMVAAKKIMVIGAGSLGSLFVSHLAYEWGSLVIADPEKLGPENVERHLLGQTDVDEAKAEQVKQWLIREKGIADTSITAHVGYADLEFLEQHTDTDLCIVCVDKKGPKRLINSWAVEHDIPLLVGGIYPRGRGGHIIVLPTPKALCYACAAHFIGEDAYEGRDPSNYGIDLTELMDSEGNLSSVPALHWPVSAVAALMAGKSLEILAGEAVVPHIQIIALGGWESTITLSPSTPETAAVTSYIMAQKALGLVPTMRLVPSNGRLSLEIKDSSQSLALTVWSECQHHNSESFSPDSI